MRWTTAIASSLAGTRKQRHDDLRPARPALVADVPGPGAEQRRGRERDRPEVRRGRVREREPPQAHREAGAPGHVGLELGRPCR